MRSGDGLAAGGQAFQGQVQARRRHQPGLFLRPQQLGGVPADLGALRHRGGIRRRAMAEGRHHGPDLAYRRAEGCQTRSDLLLDAVRRPACVHEAGARRGPVRRRQDGVAGGRLADQPAQEGIHAGRHHLRPQHAVLRPSAGLRAAEGVRAGLHGQVQGSAALGSRPRLFRDGHLQGRCRGRAEGFGQVADPGTGGRGDARSRGGKPRRQGPLPQGQDRRAGVLPGAVDQHQQVRFPDAGLGRHLPAPHSCKSRPVRISGSGSRLQKCRSEA